MNHRVIESISLCKSSSSECLTRAACLWLHTCSKVHFHNFAYPGRKRRYWSAAGKQLPKPGPLKSVRSELGDPLRVIFQQRRLQIGTQPEKKDRHLGTRMVSHTGLEIHLSTNQIAWKLRVVLPRFQLRTCHGPIDCKHLLPLCETCKILEVGAKAHQTHSPVYNSSLTTVRHT